MDKLRAIEAFIKIVDAGSITAAAEALDASQPAMVRTLAALERDLGVRLLHRTTRRMSLTDEGRDFYDRGRQIMAAVDEAQQSLSARRVSPRGRLRIASSVAFGRMFVAPVVTEFLSKHPDISVELLLLDRVVDLVEEGIDMAVRIAQLPDSSLIAHPVGEARRVVVASPKLLRTTGKPAQPSDLRGQRGVVFTALSATAQWVFGEGRQQSTVSLKPALVTNQVDTAVAACVSGTGFGRFNDYMVREHIRAGSLVRVLEQYEGSPMPVSIVYPSARHQSPNVRAFAAFARERIQEHLM